MKLGEQSYTTSTENQALEEERNTAKETALPVWEREAKIDEDMEAPKPLIVMRAVLMDNSQEVMAKTAAAATNSWKLPSSRINWGKTDSSNDNNSSNSLRKRHQRISPLLELPTPPPR